MFSTVVVGADDSSTARQAVVVAADVAQTGGGALHIVTAYDPKSVRIEALPDELRYSAGEHPAEALLRRLSELVRERGLEPIVHAPLGGGFDERDAAELVATTDARAALLLVGHEPDLSHLVAAMTGARVEMKKGGIAALRGGRLVELLRPGEIELVAGL